MSNWKMKIGSREKDTPGNFSEQSTKTIKKKIKDHFDPTGKIKQ